MLPVARPWAAASVPSEPRGTDPAVWLNAVVYRSFAIGSVCLDRGWSTLHHGG